MQLWNLHKTVLADRSACLCPGGVRYQHPLCICSKSWKQKSMGPEPQRRSVPVLFCEKLASAHIYRGRVWTLTSEVLQRCFFTLWTTKRKLVFTHANTFQHPCTVSIVLVVPVMRNLAFILLNRSAVYCLVIWPDFSNLRSAMVSSLFCLIVWTVYHYWCSSRGHNGLFILLIFLF